MQAIKETGTLRSEVMFTGEFFPEEFLSVYYDKLGDWCLRGAVSEYPLTEQSKGDITPAYSGSSYPGIWMNWN
jgi:hypothetical protein